MIIKTTPSDFCKKNGLKGLKELEAISGISKQTLINQFNNKPIVFELLVLGAFVKKNSKLKMEQ